MTAVEHTAPAPAAEFEAFLRDRVDVLVCGGGLGGVSAAMAAARTGADTLLVERNGFLGGVATAGMCCSIFSCYFTADRRMAITGNAVEVADALAEATGHGRRWRKHKGHVIYDVELGKLVLQRLLHSTGARALVETQVVGTVVEDDAVRGVIVESKSGREMIAADVVVDATGDADVAFLAGAALHAEPPSPRHSFCFRMGNVDLDAFVGYFEDHPDQYPAHMDVDWTVDEALAQYRDTGTFLFPHGGAQQMDIFQLARRRGDYPERVGVHDTVDACQMHGLREQRTLHVITGFVEFAELDEETISRAIADGREMAFEVTDFFRRELPGFEHAFVNATADDLGIRASRWLDGEFSFTSAMREDGASFRDAVGRGACYRHERKHPGEGAWSAQVFNDATFDVPLRCLLPREVDGLLMGAGRSVSADSPYLLRVMALTMVVGQAAGAAAAVAAQAGLPPREVDVTPVQDELHRQGVELG